MNADEIRKWPDTVDATPEMFHAMLLAEIAAQLAELNARMGKMFNEQGALDVVVLK